VIPLLYLLFVLSGAAGLFYESVWSRYLSLFVGHGAYAQVIVLVIFLGGMALGAGLVSRRSARLRDPLYGYAMIELAVGLVGLVFHDLIYLPATNWAYDALFPALGGGSAIAFAKWTMAGLLILPQSILLGATFPLMSAGVIRRAPDRPGAALSFLYFANSLGAAAGVLIAGFYLVQLAGLPGTLIAASILNLLVGLTALFIAKLRPPSEPALAPSGHATGSDSTSDASLLPLPVLSRLLLLAACVTALASFIYEVVWIRLLSLVLGSATHSFELMLSAFILGLSLGAFWIRRRLETIRRPLATLAAIQVMMGALAVLSLVFYRESFAWMVGLMAAVGRTDQGYVLFNLARYGLCVAIMLPATFCAGMTLPLITRTLYVSGAGEASIGAVYSWNTLGSILGAAAATLLLIPWLGLKGGLVLGGVLDMMVGFAVLVVLLQRRAPLMQATALSGGIAAVSLLAALVVRLDRAFITSGVFRTGKAATYQLMYYRDGRTATVTVSKPTQGRIGISTNGKPDGSLDPVWFNACRASDTLKTMGGDDPTQLLLPLVTLAHRPGARSIAVIGQGTGMSSHSLLASPEIESLVTLEIEPAMVEGSRAFYPANRRVFDDPRSTRVYADAKAYFAGAGRRFDLIMAEPSNPWVSGVSGLFTSEFYQRVKRYLAPGGVLGQWLHTYEISDDLVLTVLGAIHQNFSDYRVFAVNGSDLLIVAVAQGLVPDPEWKIFELPEVRRDVCHFHPIERSHLDALLLTSKVALAPLLDDTREVNSDFYPVLDLGAERARFLKRSAGAINGLFHGIYDFAGPAGNRRLVPDTVSVSGLGTVPRIAALLGSNQLRLNRRRVDPADSSWTEESIHGDAHEGIRRWLEGVRAGRLSSSWAVWTREFSAAFSAWHGGTRGWVDPSFIDPIRAWLDRQNAPSAVRAAVDFRERLARREFARAAEPAQLLLAEAADGRLWIEPDLLREGAVISFLAAGRQDLAQGAIDSLSRLAQRGPKDVRTRLLAAYAGQPQVGARAP